MATQSSTTLAASITLPTPTTYDEVLLLLKPRLPQTSSNVASLEIWKFYADLLDAYTPELLAKIRQWNTGDAPALEAGEKAIADLGRAVEAWRAVLIAPQWRFKLIVDGYDEVLLAFAQAHSEAFHEEAEEFGQDWRNWKRGA